jgi:hypothetical protein
MSDVLQAPVTLGLGALLGLAGGLLGWCVYRGVAVGPPRGSTPASVGRAAAALGHGAGDLGGGVTITQEARRRLGLPEEEARC